MTMSRRLAIRLFVRCIGTALQALIAIITEARLKRVSKE